jgi:dolichol-phosphate mannosyltransferase
MVDLIPAVDTALHLPSPAEEVRLAVVIPTFNEAKNIRSLVEAVIECSLPGPRFVIVDDDSPDGTWKIAEQLSSEYAGTEDWTGQASVTLIRRSAKMGLGSAYIEGFQHALSSGAEYVLQMDADFSHSPHYVSQMLGVMLATGADVVIGSRYVPGGTLDQGWGKGRRLLSWWANQYSRIVLGLRIRDMTAGFKLWRREALEKIDLRSIRSDHYSFQVEMAYLCEKLKFRIIEIPIHFSDRRIGQSKLGIPVKIESAIRTWLILWHHRRRRA